MAFYQEQFRQDFNGDNSSPPYNLDRHIATGGQAWVFKATADLDNHPVAFKVFQNQDNDVNPKDFAEETKRLTVLNRHDNIIKIEASGVYTRRYRSASHLYPYIAMEYADQGSLADAMRKDSGKSEMEASTKVDLLKGAMQGLVHAHERGALHRDIKPDNLLLKSKGRHTVLKVADFGIAVNGHANAASLTRTRNMAGTLPYMAPEQYDGKPVYASEVYSLGVVAYRLLAKNHVLPIVPHDANGRDNPNSNDFLAWYKAHRHGEVAAFKKPDAVSAALEPIIYRALAKDPNKRYRSMAEFHQSFADAASKALADLRKHSVSIPLVPTRIEMPRGYTPPRVEPPKRRPAPGDRPKLPPARPAAPPPGLRSPREDLLAPPGNRPPMPNFNRPPMPENRPVVPPIVPVELAPPARPPIPPKVFRPSPEIYVPESTSEGPKRRVFLKGFLGVVVLGAGGIYLKREGLPDVIDLAAGPTPEEKGQARIAMITEVAQFIDNNSARSDIIKMIGQFDITTAISLIPLLKDVRQASSVWAALAPFAPLQATEAVKQYTAQKEYAAAAEASMGLVSVVNTSDTPNNETIRSVLAELQTALMNAHYPHVSTLIDIAMMQDGGLSPDYRGKYSSPDIANRLLEYNNDPDYQFEFFLLPTALAPRNMEPLTRVAHTLVDTVATLKDPDAVANGLKRIVLLGRIFSPHLPNEAMRLVKRLATTFPDYEYYAASLLLDVAPFMPEETKQFIETRDPIKYHASVSLADYSPSYVKKLGRKMKDGDAVKAWMMAATNITDEMYVKNALATLTQETEEVDQNHLTIWSTVMLARAMMANQRYKTLQAK